MVAEVYLASRKAFLPYAPVAHPDEEVRRWIAEQLIPGGDVWIAAIAGVIAGMMALARNGDTGWINQLYIHPNQVKRGIGRLLLRRAKREMGAPIRLYTFLQNAAARCFYEQHGFRAVVFSDGSGNEEKMADVLYEWDDGARAMVDPSR